jgi:hypothetical protein
MDQSNQPDRVVGSFPSQSAGSAEVRLEEAMLRITQAMLTQAGIDPQEWGQASGSKTLRDLADELEAGEIRLQLLRTTSVVRIDVRYHDAEQGIEYQLYEHSQEYFQNEMPAPLRRECGDWEVLYTRERSTDANEWAIWEKQKPGETYEESALRALTVEELQLAGEVTLLNRDEFEYVEPPIDYPGLETYLRGASFTVHLTSEQFNTMQEGHTEVQDRKQTHFRWKKV